MKGGWVGAREVTYVSATSEQTIITYCFALCMLNLVIIYHVKYVEENLADNLVLQYMIQIIFSDKRKRKKIPDNLCI